MRHTKLSRGKDLGGVRGCFAEIHDVDVDLHFLEFFGDLLRIVRAMSKVRVQSGRKQKAHLDKLLNFVGDGRGDEDDEALSRSLDRSARMSEPRFKVIHAGR